MKLRQLFTSLLCACTVTAFAQSNEVYVGYGVSPRGIGAVSAPWKAFSMVSSDSQHPYVHPTYADKTSSSNGNALTVGYMRRVIAGLSVGASYSYFTTKSIDRYDEADLDMEIYTAKAKNHVIMLHAKYQWLSFKRISLYAKAGAGVKITGKYLYDITNDAWYGPGNDKPGHYYATGQKMGEVSYKHFAYSVMPLGVDFKVVPCVYLYAEGGYGTLGYLQCGVKTKF